MTDGMERGKVGKITRGNRDALEKPPSGLELG